MHNTPVGNLNLSKNLVFYFMVNNTFEDKFVRRGYLARDKGDRKHFKSKK